MDLLVITVFKIEICQIIGKFKKKLEKLEKIDFIICKYIYN